MWSDRTNNLLYRFTTNQMFVAAWIGGGIAGGILGALGGKMYSLGGDGLFRIPAMINPNGIDVSFMVLLLRL